MPKVKYDYTDVEDRDQTYEEYDGPEPPRGVYTFRVKSITANKSNNDNPQLVVIATIAEKDPEKEKFNGWPGWIYLVQTEDSAWKTKQFTEAIGVTKPGDKKGTWDTDEVVKKAMTFRAKIRHENYEGEPRAKIGRLLLKKVEEESGSKGSKSDKKGKKNKSLF